MTSFTDLVGEHELKTVPRLDLRHPQDSDASGCIFTLDDHTYLVFEDPSDGYRSQAAPLLSFPGQAYQLGVDNHEYIRLPVLCSVEDGGEVLVMRAKSTGAVVFRVGTDNSDDYYPSYVAQWDAAAADAACKATGAA